MRANLEAFRRWRIVPRVLRQDLSVRDLSLELLGTRCRRRCCSPRSGCRPSSTRRGARLRPSGVDARAAADHQHGFGHRNGGDRRGERRRTSLVPARPAQRRRDRGEPGSPCRGGRRLGARPHRRQLRARLEAPRPPAGLPPLPRGSGDRPIPLGPSIPGGPREDAGGGHRRRRGALPRRLRQPEPDLGAARMAARETTLPIVLKGILHPEDAARRASGASTGSSSPTTAAARSTARSPRSTRCPRSSTPSASGWRSCSTAASAPGPTSSRRSPSAPTPSWSAVPTSGD